MSFECCEIDFSRFMKALQFAARKHRDQRRKGGSAAPYINHLVSVTEILWRVGGVRDTDILTAAMLHDTVEDTGTTPEEIAAVFGETVRSLVMEATDDKSLPKQERKRLQIVNAPHKSPGARKIKLADKISNVTEIVQDPPKDWSYERRSEYLDWTRQVIDGLRGQNPELEAYYDATLADAKRLLEAER